LALQSPFVPCECADREGLCKVGGWESCYPWAEDGDGDKDKPHKATCLTTVHSLAVMWLGEGFSERSMKW